VLVEGVGVQSYASKHAPCYICKATKAQLHVDVPWDDHRTAAEYEIAIYQSIKEFRVTPSQWDILRRYLHHSKAWRGTAVIRPQPVTAEWTEHIFPLGIRHGDLLIANTDVPDPHAAPTLTTGNPLMLQFWRRNKRGPVQFLSPLAKIPGWSLPGILRLDCLHVVDLGVCRVLGFLSKDLHNAFRLQRQLAVYGERLRGRTRPTPPQKKKHSPISIPRRTLRGNHGPPHARRRRVRGEGRRLPALSGQPSRVAS
jgi:hypothetical protein